MHEPEEWLSQYRLNTCNEPECGHYLHDGPCEVSNCKCLDGLGRLSFETVPVEIDVQQQARRLRSVTMRIIALDSHQRSAHDGKQDDECRACHELIKKVEQQSAEYEQWLRAMEAV